MSHALEKLIDRFTRRVAGGGPLELTGSGSAVVIRLARDADLPLLHDLAELDSAAALRGAALVAIVDGRPWAAHGLDDDRVIADPFEPSAAAVGLLRLRVHQVREAQARPRSLRWRGRVPARAGTRPAR